MISETDDQEVDERMLWADFLERIPPGSITEIADLCEHKSTGGGPIYVVSTPDLQLYCGSDSCQGVRFFSCAKGPGSAGPLGMDFFMEYTCRNCRETKKTFAIRAAVRTYGDTHGIAVKLGELPTFGPPVPARVMSLVGPDRDLFLRGRRAENQGLGVGAFAYYRRVVEDQKGRLIGEIAKVARRVGAGPDVLDTLDKATTETQFSKAVDDVKAAIPQVLLIEGHNPLKLLHSALSEGLHKRSDEECLQLATSIRVVLTELSERISQALKDEDELRQAVRTLVRPFEQPVEPETQAPATSVPADRRDAQAKEGS